MAIETLTDADRGYLALDGLDAGPSGKALRIIDAQEEVIGAMSAQIAAIKHDHAEELARLRASFSACEVAQWKERAEALRVELDKANVVGTSLRAEVERLQKSEAEWKFWRGTAVKACDRAESRHAAEVERLRAELKDQPALCFECYYTHRPSEGHGRRRDIG